MNLVYVVGIIKGDQGLVSLFRRSADFNAVCLSAVAWRSCNRQRMKTQILSPNDQNMKMHHLFHLCINLQSIMQPPKNTIMPTSHLLPLTLR